MSNIDLWWNICLSASRLVARSRPHCICCFLHVSRDLKPLEPKNEIASRCFYSLDIPARNMPTARKHCLSFLTVKPVFPKCNTEVLIFFIQVTSKEAVLCPEVEIELSEISRYYKPLLEWIKTLESTNLELFEAYKKLQTISFGSDPCCRPIRDYLQDKLISNDITSIRHEAMCLHTHTRCYKKHAQLPVQWK